MPEDKKKAQGEIDAQLQAIVEKGNEYMKHYLKSYFTLVPGQPPHAIRF